MKPFHELTDEELERHYPSEPTEEDVREAHAWAEKHGTKGKGKNKRRMKVLRLLDAEPEGDV